jgi:serine protease Do
MQSKAYPAKLLLTALVGAILGGGAAGWIRLRRPVRAFWEMQGASRVPKPGPVAQGVRSVGPCVVKVSSRTDQPGLSSGFGVEGEAPRALNVGSGVVLDAARGYIVTDAHLVEKAKQISVAVPGRGRRYTARLLGSDSFTDLAVLSIEARGLKQARLGSAHAQPVGSWVIAIGNPLGFANTVTVGVVSAKGRQLGRDSGFPLEDLIQTDAAINEGNSGGALANLRGEVIGICTTAFPQSIAHGLGFAVSAEKVSQVVPVLVKHGKVVRAWLGVWLSKGHPPEAGKPAPEAGKPEKAGELRLQAPAGLSGSPRGALIERVEPGSPASTAGLANGDVVVSAGGKKVDSPEALQAVVRQHRPGEKLNLVVRRGARSLSTTVVLAEMPQKPQR